VVVGLRVRLVGQYGSWTLERSGLNLGGSLARCQGCFERVDGMVRQPYIGQYAFIAWREACCLSIMDRAPTYWVQHAQAGHASTRYFRFQSNL